MWELIVWVCAAYAFLGFVVLFIATTTGNSTLVGLALAAYVLNLVLLGYARKKP